MIQYNRRFSQKKDIWAFGLVFLSILSQEASQEGMPPLSCITSKTNLQGSSIFDGNVEDLTQEELDLEVDLLMKKNIPDCKDKQAEERLWNLVKKILKVNPEERPTITKIDHMWHDMMQ